MANGTVTAYRFGDFILNVNRCCLQRSGRDLDLRPKAYEILLYLVERAGTVASKDELVEFAWPNVTVSDDSLAQCVSDIRKLLGDDEQRLIKTVPRKGYVFIADVDTLENAHSGSRVKSEEPKKQVFPVIGRLHFGSFAIGFALPVLLIGTWLALTSILATETLKAPFPKYPVFQGNKTILGQTIAYPSGTPVILAADLVSQPGQSFDWHLHKTPAFGYILEGEVTVDYGSKGSRVFRAGDAFLEALDWPHRPSNHGTTAARILAIYVGVEGTDFSTPVAEPK